MSLDETYLQEAEDRLAAVSPPLRDALRESLADLTAGLTDAQLRLFVDEGLELASRSLRSWEAGPDYSRIAPLLLARMDEASFRQWAAGGRALAELAAAIAGAYFKASPDVLPALAGAQMGEWAHLGERLYKATWKSISLASTFFALSPVLLRRLTLSELGRLARVLEGISARSAPPAAGPPPPRPPGLRPIRGRRPRPARGRRGASRPPHRPRRGPRRPLSPGSDGLPQVSTRPRRAPAPGRAGGPVRGRPRHPQRQCRGGRGLLLPPGPHGGG